MKPDLPDILIEFTDALDDASDVDGLINITAHRIRAEALNEAITAQSAVVRQAQDRLHQLLLQHIAEIVLAAAPTATTLHLEVIYPEEYGLPDRFGNPALTDSQGNDVVASIDLHDALWEDLDTLSVVTEAEEAEIDLAAAAAGDVDAAYTSAKAIAERIGKEPT